jgi:transcriptional accessory protein Tex/SPT6
MKKRIIKVIEEMGLTEEELKEIPFVKIEEIAKKAKCDDIDVMYYLRYER